MIWRNTPATVHRGIETIVQDNHLFAFEHEFVANLECIPMAVRFKLDRTAIKLALTQWSAFTGDDRQSLLDIPCNDPAEVAAYRERLVELVKLRTGEDVAPLTDPPAPQWEAPDEVPPAIEAHARSVGALPPTVRQWAKLAELQRFALVKLSRDNHDNVNFVPALREFGLT